MAADTKESLLIDRVQKTFPDAVLETRIYKDEVTHRVDRSALLSICDFLKKDSELQMNCLVDVLGVDYTPLVPRFEVVYHLFSIPRRHRIRLKVRIDEGESIPTVTGIWPAADWPEREAYDMFGIVFDGHPNLKRIYMAPDWEGFPLRKDYPLRGYKDEYNPFGEEKEDI
ncbi:MAG: NADH-quinone oxidoreductase subunit C [Desulfobacteraceae bacterium]|nr:MAG: NADH-quinone oxidoreductase subunit C [Desulfobacteraceae bacterium]